MDKLKDSNSVVSSSTSKVVSQPPGPVLAKGESERVERGVRLNPWELGGGDARAQPAERAEVVRRNFAAGTFSDTSLASRDRGGIARCFLLPKKEIPLFRFEMFSYRITLHELNKVQKL
eukprot:Hpha_TRINITY_DN14658_c0_g1::TRINITY_DN14658_c0_g1_i1::g.48428::m.48428